MSKWPDDNKDRKFTDCKNNEQTSLLWWKEHLDHFDSKEVKALSIMDRSIYFDVVKMMARYFDCWNPGALKISQKLFCDHLSFKDSRTRKKSLATLAKLQLVFSWREFGYVIIYCPYFEKITEKIAEDRIKRRKNPAGSKPESAGDLLARCKLYAPGLC